MVSKRETGEGKLGGKEPIGATNALALDGLKASLDGLVFSSRFPSPPNHLGCDGE